MADLAANDADWIAVCTVGRSGDRELRCMQCGESVAPLDEDETLGWLIGEAGRHMIACPRNDKEAMT